MLEVDSIADVLRSQALVVDVLHVGGRYWVQVDLRSRCSVGGRRRTWRGFNEASRVEVEVEAGRLLESSHVSHLRGIGEVAVVAQRKGKM